MERCKYCGAGYEHTQNGITRYKCGSSYGEGFNPPWSRPVECYHDENELLKGQLDRLERDMGNLQLYVTHVETELIDLNKRLKALDFGSTTDGKALAEVIRIVEAKP